MSAGLLADSAQWNGPEHLEVPPWPPAAFPVETYTYRCTCTCIFTCTVLFSVVLTTVMSPFFRGWLISSSLSRYFSAPEKMRTGLFRAMSLTFLYQLGGNKPGERERECEC